MQCIRPCLPMTLPPPLWPLQTLRHPSAATATAAATTTATAAAVSTAAAAGGGGRRGTPPWRPARILHPCGGGTPPSLA